MYPTIKEMDEQEKRCLDDLNIMIEEVGMDEFVKRGISVFEIEREHGNRSFNNINRELIEFYHKHYPKPLWYYFRTNGEV